jgi:30S ribosomal protein S31
MTHHWPLLAKARHSFPRRGNATMGKGDKRTKRGKIFKGTFGKRRPKNVKKAPKPKA